MFNRCAVSCSNLDVFFDDVWDGCTVSIMDWEGWEVCTFDTWEDVPESWLECEVIHAEKCTALNGSEYWEIMLADVDEEDY